MNKIYKIVWNASLGAWVAVSEIAKGKTKVNSGTVGDIVIDQKNEITIKKSFNYKVLYVAVFTMLTPSFAFSAVGNNSIDTRLCAATAAAYSSGDIAVGCGSDSSGTNSIAIGGNATTKVNTGSTQGGQSIAIGYDAQTKGDQSVGLGANVRASGNSSIAIGGDDLNKVAGTNNNTAAAVTYKNLTGDNLIRTYDAATGPNSQYYGTTTGDGAVAIGVQASALGNLATSFGTRTQANGVASTALGVGATSDKDGSVALGAGSRTDGSATKVQSATVNGLGFTGFVGTSGFAGTASDAGRQVSVGNIGNERQIKNVAPGAISAISTDAINGSQIYAVTNTLIGQIQTTKSASPVVYTDTTGNKLTKANDGKWYLSTAVDAGGNAIGSPTEVVAANVATRLQDANGSTTTPIKLTNVADGTVAANSKDAVNGGQLKSVIDAQTATDNAAVKYDNAATKDKVTLGGATGTTITNVKDGALNATSTDAVNGRQLYATNQNVAQNTTSISTLTTTVSNHGTQITTNTADISILKGGFTLQTNGANAGAIKAGDTVDIGVADPVDTNLTATKIGKNIAFALNKDLNLTSVMTGNTVINNAGITADKVSVGNVVIDKTTNKISGIEAGTNSKDAVNKGQLDTLAAQQAATDSAAVKYDNAATKDKVTLGGGVAGTTITNVKDGALNASSTDAVNGRQLYATNQNVAQNTTSINALNTTVNNHGTQISSNTTDISTLKGGFTLQTNGANAGAIKAGDTVDIGVADLADTNLTATKTGKDIAFALSKDLSLTSVTTGNTVINSAGLTADKVTVGNVVIDKTTNKITGIEAGTSTKDAVNKGQLDTLAAQQTATDSAAVKYDNAATKDKVTLGGGVAGTTITNVKDGALNASSTDTVNGRQLYATNQNVAQNTTSISTLTTTVSNHGTQISTNTTDISTLKGGFTLQTNGANAGAIKAGDTVDIGVADPTDTNLTATKTGKDIAFALSKDLNLTSVTTGNTVINSAGLTADKVTVGNVVIDKTTNKITGIEAGTSTKDAVNKGQLDALAAQQTATDSAAVKYDNALTKDKVTLGGTTTSSTKDAITGKITTTGGTSLSNVASAGDYTNIANASKGVNAGDLNNAVIDAKTAVTNTGIKFGNGTSSNQYKLGDIINVKASTDGSITSTTTADGVQLGLGNTVKVGSGATQITVDGSTGKIGGLSNKTWNAASITSGQAATEDQLKLVSDAQTATDSAAVKYDKAATKDKVTLGGGAAGTTITNVKAGGVNASSTDAINGSQLYTVSNSIKNAIGGSTTINAVTGAITTTNIGGTGANTIDGAINSVSNTAKAAKTEVKEGDNIKVTSVVGVDGQSVYTVATAQDVSFDKVTVGGVVLNKANSDITGLSNKDLKAADFATKGRAATEEQLKQVISSNITEVVDASGNKVNIIDQVVNTKLDNTNQDSLFLTYNKQGQETTDRLTIGQTVQKMNTEGTKFFHTNADTSNGDLGTTNDSSASGLNSTAIGVNAIVAAGADSSVALGHNAKVQGAQSIAIGHGAEALGTQSISIGTGNKVKGNHSGAIGDPTIVNGSNSYSVGNNNQVLTDDTFVLGNNITKTVAGSVVLGTGSAATTGAGVTGYALSTATNVDKTAINKTTSTTGAVAVGDAASGIYRQITGVAAGTQDADAVNVAQLKAVGNQVVTTQNSLVNSLGGNATVNANGTIIGPTYNVAKSTQTNVGDALDALDKAIASTAVTSKTTVTKGQNIVVNKSKNVDGSDNYEIATAKDLTVDSVKAGNTILNNAGITIGNNTVVLNNTGLIIAGGPSVTTQGINAGNKQITNVAAGTNTTDAVNKGQLDSAINSVASDVTQLSNNAVKYDTASKDKITLGGSNGTTITNLKDGAVVQGSKDAVNGGQLWTVQQQVNQNTNDIQGIQTNISNINNGKSGLVQQQTQGGDITVGKDAGGTTLNVSGTQGDRVVTGVKDGAVNATSKDAVNGSQLNVTNNKVAEFLGGGAGYNNITNSFTNPTYKVDGKDYNNVGGAVDALNKADQALGNRITNLGDRLEQAFTETNQRIDGIEKKANAGIAAAMALEAAPFVAGKFTYAAGASYHGGENAIGVTLRKTADNGRWSITGGVAAASQGDPSVRIGISGVID